ncbi:MAG: two pore domain potassium channel family protein [Theionarchaea archaeon]|nr:two pore domain potassium channel family protein [Theionarchaea archaeon]
MANLAKARFHKADLENVDFAEDCNWLKSKGFLEHLFGPNTRTYEEECRENLSLKQLEDIYRNLRLSMKRHGKHSEAGDFHYREMECRKESMRKERFSLSCLKSIGYSFLKCTCGYGETPGRVIIVSLLVISTASLFFMFNGISIEKNTPEEYTVDYDLIEVYNAFANHDMPSVSLIVKVIEDFGQCFYHSVVTFTTLGYGDIHPIGLVSKSVACFESFLGALFMALFVLVISHKVRA